MRPIFTFLLWLVFVSVQTTLAQSAWELKKDKDNILVYTREQKESRFNELKAVFDLKGNFSQLRSILEDVSQYPNWVYSTKSSNIVERRGAGDLIYYAEVSAPWPLSNRDYYSETRIWVDSAQQKMHVSSHSLTDIYPVKKHLVRIPLLKAEWTITRVAAANLHVEYTLQWNPGGSIPPWVANLFSTMGPYQSFSELKKKMTFLNSK
jgi:hypothetical protein